MLNMHERKCLPGTGRAKGCKSSEFEAMGIQQQTMLQFNNKHSDFENLLSNNWHYSIRVHWPQHCCFALVSVKANKFHDCMVDEKATEYSVQFR